MDRPPLNTLQLSRMPKRRIRVSSGLVAALVLSGALWALLVWTAVR